MSALFSFPNPVNEKAARSVAGLVVVLATVTLVLRSEVLVVLLAAGFLARVLTGPTLSPFGQLATRVIAPRLGPPKLVPGPPKRFAQGMGLVMTGTAAVLALVGVGVVPWVLVGLVIVAALLESAFAICLGCIVFGRLQRLGLIPASVCEECANVGQRWSATAPAA
ncbi:DUF4395 family protein [Nakamurella sp. YIM 132087]|uniref:DUF4395 family protein n=1 Tax=Nakamurella alba TaxID=2665158 RepID=A0A7K1FGQ5_9ACTN|nr:DUF4395 domain-containing protein [Nakamurella alba]MTD13292.1 DUF4395 family protein [Nakamurella alba]